MPKPTFIVERPVPVQRHRRAPSVLSPDHRLRPGLVHMQREAWLTFVIFDINAHPAIMTPQPCRGNLEPAPMPSAHFHEDPTPTSEPRLSREQARRVDRLAHETLGLPGVVLMENAAINASSAILDWVEMELQRVPDFVNTTILCGSGNNAGDGYAVARHLTLWNVPTSVVALRPLDALTGDAHLNAHAAQAMGIPIDPWPDNAERAAELLGSGDLIVDAVLGTGFEGTLRPPLTQAVNAINQTGKPTVSLDIPTGLDADTGQPSPVAVEADLTVTFVAPKLGFGESSAEPFLGRVLTAEIGIPTSLVEQALRDPSES